MKTASFVELPILSPSSNGQSSRKINSDISVPGNAAVLDTERIKEQFAEFLKEKKYRNTQERYLVLDGVLAREEHFSADELYLALRTSNIQVSRATVYSTLDLLTRCNILVKHRFQGDSARFELAAKMPNHDHLICTDCGHIVEFQEDVLSEIQARVATENGFKPVKHSLQIFAVCQDARNCEHNEQKRP